MNTDKNRKQSKSSLFSSAFIRVHLRLIFLLLISAARADTNHEFVFDASNIDPKPKTVHLAGDFNGWSKVATPMSDSGGGVFKVTIPLAEGVHHYKLVLDGEKWVNDPKNSDKELEIDDNYGGKNSALLIGPDARKLPPPAPDKINCDGILHRPQDSQDVNVAAPNLLRLRLQAQAGDVQEAFVNVKDDAGMKTYVMHACGSSMGYESFGVAVTTQGENAAYWFTLNDGQAKVLVSAG